MNERIRELEAQCWEPRQYGPAWFNSTKFAELIVKECISVCESATREGQPLHLVSIGYADRIKQHFGVEQ